jgi:hypothetical protein
MQDFELTPKSSVTDPDDFCPDRDATYQIVRIRIPAYINFVPTYSSKKFFNENALRLFMNWKLTYIYFYVQYS